MNNDLFRKVALEKLSSPEQLDQTMRVAGPLYWTSLLAIMVALSAAGVWSVIGHIPTKSIGDGAIIRPGGVFNISSSGAGFVKDFKVKAGDHVRANQVVADIDQPLSNDDIVAAEHHVAELRRLEADAVSLRQDDMTLQLKSLNVQRENAKGEIVEQQKMAKIAADDVAVNEQLVKKGLITRQPLVEAQQRLAATQAAVGRLQASIAQIDAQKFQANLQPGEIKKQRDLEIADQEARLQTMRNQFRRTSAVVDPINGEVVEEKVYTGSLIAAGTSVISVQPDIGQVLAVIYVPSALAADVKTGMDAEVSPSTAKREEFGFIRGKVTFVGHYPATTEGMMSLLENDSLVTSLRARGTVTEIDIAMEKSTDTPSGFRWSSSRGPESQIEPGMLCSAQIVTRSQRPIELVFPFLKKLAGVQ